MCSSHPWAQRSTGCLVASLGWWDPRGGTKTGCLPSMSTHLPASLPPPWGDSAISLFLRPPCFSLLVTSLSLLRLSLSLLPCLFQVAFWSPLHCAFARWSLPFSCSSPSCSPLLSLSASPSAGAFLSFFICQGAAHLFHSPLRCAFSRLACSPSFPFFFRLSSDRHGSFHLCFPLHCCLLSSSLSPEQQGHCRFGLLAAGPPSPRTLRSSSPSALLLPDSGFSLSLSLSLSLPPLSSRSYTPSVSLFLGALSARLLLCK